MTLSQVIEALLFSSQKALTTKELHAALKNAGEEDGPGQEVVGHLELRLRVGLGRVVADAQVALEEPSMKMPHT